MSLLFERKPLVSASIIVSFVFIVLALFVAGSIDFSRQEEGKGAGIAWSSPAGSGVSVPACGSSSNLAPTCAGSSPSVTVNWTWIPNAAHPRECNLVNLGIYKSGVQVQGYQRACNDSIIWTGGESNTPYTYNVYFVDVDGNPPIETASGSFTTPDCARGGGNAPIAEAGISKDGSLFSTSISVLRGVPVQIWFSADKDVTGDGISSRDPDGWNNLANGVSSGGLCEWNVDLASPGFAVQRTVRDPASPASCNLGPLAKTFNDAPGTYLYEVLRITDAAAFESNISTVFVTVTSPVSVSLIANPPIINPGGTSLLTWDTEGFGPGDCSIDQGIGSVAPDGSRPVSPIVTTRYTLSCSNAFNSASTQATVYVSTVPIIKEIPPR